MARRGKSSPVATMVKAYGDSGSYAKDAKKLAKQGWAVVNTTHRQPRAGIGRIVTLGLFTLLRPPKPELVVAYQRTRNIANTAAQLRFAAAPVAGALPPGKRPRSSGGSPLRTIVIVAFVVLVIVMVFAR